MTSRPRSKGSFLDAVFASCLWLGFAAGLGGCAINPALDRQPVSSSANAVEDTIRVKAPPRARLAEEPSTPALLEARDTMRQEYKIAPQDLLHIVVYQESDLEREVRVNQAGTISLPLIGEVNVLGLSAMNAETKIRDLFAQYLVSPQVSVDIKEYHARQAFVLGEVMKPGAYDIPSDRPLTVVGAIALAGGFSKMASPDKTRVVRQIRGKVTSLIIPIRQITAGDKSQDVTLLPDDIVYVPQTFF